MLILASLHLLICFGLMLQTRLFRVAALTDETLQAMKLTNWRTLRSGRWTDARKKKRKLIDAVREFVWNEFRNAWKSSVLASVAIASIFLATLLALLGIDLLSVGVISLEVLLTRTRALVFGFVDSLTFDAFAALGVKHEVVDFFAAGRLVNFTFLASTTLIAGGTLVTVLKNFLVMTTALVFPTSFVQAAHPALELDEGESARFVWPIRMALFPALRSDS